MLKGKKIVLGISGSIAAYKACLIIRDFVKRGAEVQVIITPSGKEFITPVTLSTLTGKPVISDFFSQRDGTWHSHVDLGLWADAMLIAPATASTIGKMANGIANNMLITTYLSMKAPVFIAPAMDLDMFAHPAMQRNLDILRRLHHVIIEPSTGELASHLIGKGRMEEPDVIVRMIDDYFEKKDLQDKNVLITAGPTYERIDPVRFIGNYSSGKMGFALAEECVRRGAFVTLVTGPTSLCLVHSNIRRINVESAQEMGNVVQKEFVRCDVAVLAAAVADFTPVEIADKKIKREKDNLSLKLKPTEDIAASLGRLKNEGNRSRLLVGFALETDDEQNHAEEKLRRKNLDFIILNSLRDKGSGFGYDTNKITIIDRKGQVEYPLESKGKVARDIVDRIVMELVQ